MTALAEQAQFRTPNEQSHLYEVTPTPSSDFGLDTLVKYGYNPEYEAARARKLHAALGEVGDQIAYREQRMDRAAWVKEFLQDDPVSLPRTYWHIDGRLHSHPAQHDLTAIETSIHPSERDGATTRGFNEYQNLVDDPTDPNEVVIWYSPAGPGGTKDGFENLSYESGRLYMGFKKDDESSVHFDVKIQEGEDVEFPVLDVLNHISGRQAEDLSHYLENPFRAGDTRLFFHMLENMPESLVGQDHPVYISRRNEEARRRVHTWGDVITQVQQALHEHRHEDVVEALSQADINGMQDAAAIHKAFQVMLHDFAAHEGVDELFLYGCSTTSLVEGIAGSMSGGEAYNGSIFSTLGRASRAKESWAWKAGTCRPKDEGGCGKRTAETGKKVGPCDICEACQARYDKQGADPKTTAIAA